jgi:hypothetical protein
VNHLLTDRRAEAYAKVWAEKGKTFAFVAVLPQEDIEGVGAALGMAIANERGYMPVPLGWAAYATFDAASDHADHLNETVLKIDNDEAFKIVASTMDGMRYTAPTP